MPITQFIPKEERQHQSALIHAMAQAVYGTAEDAAFTEEFVPERGKVGEPKVQIFTNFLINNTDRLWAIFSDANKTDIAGFFLIMPSDEIGFGLKSTFSGQNIMTKAWKEIAVHPAINYPLNARTSKRNLGAIRFLEKVGFVNKGETNFMGEDSWMFQIS
jgi:RimJ/RimL family protein N-acetyltransferase